MINKPTFEIVFISCCMVQVPVTCLQLGWDDDGVRPWQVEDGGTTLGCYNVEDMHR